MMPRMSRSDRDEILYSRYKTLQPIENDLRLVKSINYKNIRILDHDDIQINIHRRPGPVIMDANNNNKEIKCMPTYTLNVRWATTIRRP
ncbi:unnamed protein product [Didymodactylos carnosus]|uniref:Uncharacterized protein n=1 Tax=Didymodactylos carnosus TaxID=1234261 RepID=A0A815PMV9_9BILA|nr:unnamed protein product [Didymodactylos carnosus]CAF1451590.1 unnamed protein product [Didymodactylos carnosus]CAF3829724.1 unnamed protein product [Didymodactylos carnosus]CAF4324687.1 unnamed protein product [Didymodactylos carnosus]